MTRETGPQECLGVSHCSFFLCHRMERYVQGKETLERDLYSRFVLVLNEKKAKLRVLQERVRELEESIEENRLR